MRQLGRVKISVEMLEELLRLPIDHSILEIKQDYEDRLRNEFTLVCEGPDLPKVREGEQIPELSVIYETIQTHFKTD